MNERVIESIKSQTLRPLDVRILRISNDAEVFLTFTNDMVFPTNFADTLNGRDTKKVSNDTMSANNERLLDQNIVSREVERSKKVNGTDFLFIKMLSYEI